VTVAIFTAMSHCTSRRPDRALTIREAAEILYKTKRPTAQQIRRLRERFERGAPTGEGTAEQECPKK